MKRLQGRYMRVAIIGAGAVSFSLAAVVAAPMAGMDMPGMVMPGAKTQAAQNAIAAITLRPNPPIMGDNTLDILVTDPASGKPIAGLKIDAVVSMESMDMGTTRVRAKELGGGRYRAIVTFSMNGPWRVILTGIGSGGRLSTTLHFMPGSKAPWKQPAQSAGEASPAPGGDADSGNPPSGTGKGKTGMNMPGMNMPGMNMPGMNMPGMNM
ncbi:MAG: FixH family protein, partial [Chloroflexi bacterium]|nr:FixH family protein [Chloroflexota bacterium]